MELLVAYLAVLFWAFLAHGQGQNTLAPYNPKLRTLSANGTWFIIPVNKQGVQEAVGKYPLLPLPTHDKTLFPYGFPKGMHPVLIDIIYQNDIRRGNLEIDALMACNVYVPYVDRLGDGHTPFQYPIITYIGGANGQDLMGVVPAVVGSITSQPIKVAEIRPDNAAYQSVGADEYSTQVKRIVVPNPVSGPKIGPAAVDFDFFTATKPRFTAHTFHSLMNQAAILTHGMGKCQRNTAYFNESFAHPVLRTGKVVLYPQSLPKGIAGVYSGLTGYSGNAVEVGYDPQDCRAAAKMVDPKSQM